MIRLILPLLLALATSCTSVPAEESLASALVSEPTSEDADAPGPGGLEIRFLDVGQGDAVLLRAGARAALIDAGPSDRIVRRLRELGVDSLALLVASHNHADHIGGADAVLDSIPVRFYLDNGFPANTRIQERVLQRVEEKGITYLAAEPRILSLGRARLHILPSPLRPPDDQNNRSVLVRVELEGFQALLTGDSEVEQINALLAAGAVPNVDVLKAAHHGSRNGVTPAWLARTDPEVVVISLGAGNGYGHPHAAALRYYCAGGRRVLRTDRHGEVVLRVHGSGAYDVETERRAPEECARAVAAAVTSRTAADIPPRSEARSSRTRASR